MDNSYAILFHCPKLSNRCEVLEQDSDSAFNSGVSLIRRRDLRTTNRISNNDRPRRGARVEVALSCAATEEPEQPRSAAGSCAAPAAEPAPLQEIPAAEVAAQQQPAPAAPARLPHSPNSPFRAESQPCAAQPERMEPIRQDSGSMAYMANPGPGRLWAYREEYSPRRMSFSASPTFAQMAREGTCLLDQRPPF